MPVCARLCPGQIFLENINNILSAGEVPNLFEDADLGAIFDKMTPLCLQAGLAASKTNLYAMFIKMCKKYLKIVLAMSPLGDEYSNRIRQFPSLINCAPPRHATLHDPLGFLVARSLPRRVGSGVPCSRSSYPGLSHAGHDRPAKTGLRPPNPHIFLPRCLNPFLSTC